MIIIPQRRGGSFSTEEWKERQQHFKFCFPNPQPRPNSGISPPNSKSASPPGAESLPNASSELAWIVTKSLSDPQPKRRELNLWKFSWRAMLHLMADAQLEMKIAIGRVAKRKSTERSGHLKKVAATTYRIRSHKLSSIRSQLSRCEGYCFGIENSSCDW